MLHSEGQPLQSVSDGAEATRLVFYEYCISLVFITLRRSSPLIRVPAGTSGILPGLRYSLITMMFGWWGIPWGLLYTPLVLWTNLSGGREITPAELGRWQPSEQVRA